MVVRGVPYENNPPLRENILTVGMCGFTSTMAQLSRYTGGDEVNVLANDHVICAQCHRRFKERYKWHEIQQTLERCEEEEEEIFYGNGNRNDARSCWCIIREAWHTLWTNEVAEDECTRLNNNTNNNNNTSHSRMESSQQEQQHHEREHLNVQGTSHDLFFPVIYRATCDIAPRLLHNIFACPEVHEVVHSVNCCQCCQGPLEQTHSYNNNNNHNNNMEHHPLRCYEMSEENISESTSSSSCCCCCCFCCSSCCCWTCNPIHWLLMFKEWMCGHLFHVKPYRCCYSELGRINMGGNRDQSYFTHQIRRAVQLLQREEETLCPVHATEQYESVQYVTEEESRQHPSEMENIVIENVNYRNNSINIVTSKYNKLDNEEAENVTDSINTINVQNDLINVNRQEQQVYIRSDEHASESLHLINIVPALPLVEQQTTQQMDAKCENAENRSICNNNVSDSRNSINYCIEAQIARNTNNEPFPANITSSRSESNNNGSIVRPQELEMPSSSPSFHTCNHENHESIRRRRHLVLFGVSRGATTCFYTAMKLPAELASYVSLVIVEAPFDTLQHVIASSTWFPSLTMWLFKSFCDYRGGQDEKTAYSYDPAQVELRCPVAFVLSKIDQRVPNACTLHLINTLRERLVPHVIPAVEVLVLEHSRHPCMPLSNKADQDAYVAFVERLYATYCQ